jgi:hypothetical protein
MNEIETFLGLKYKEVERPYGSVYFDEDTTIWAVRIHSNNPAMLERWKNSFNLNRVYPYSEEVIGSYTFLIRYERNTNNSKIEI